jgi:uroporphyrinogen-III synthase
MIPAVIPPLTSLSVLVTRPARQAAALAANIAALGGEPIVFPSIAIEPIAVSAPAAHDLAIFVSVHAVEHGGRFIQKSGPNSNATRIAAIGKATAAALAAMELPADVVPAVSATSEGLLENADLMSGSIRSVLIVRGEGGRDTLREAFVAKGSSVTLLEVYRRVTPSIAANEIEALETRWADLGIDVVTATSVETYLRLDALLSQRGRALLRESTLLAPSHRIIDAARENGWHGDALLSGGADDLAILGTLARWRARARGTVSSPADCK